MKNGDMYVYVNGGEVCNDTNWREKKPIMDTLCIYFYKVKPRWLCISSGIRYGKTTLIVY